MSPEDLSRILELIISHVHRHGYQPSLGELAKSVGVPKTEISTRLAALQEEGFVELPLSGERNVVLNHVRFRSYTVEER